MADTAQVVKLHPFGDGVDQKLVGEAVGQDVPTVNSQMTITVALYGPFP